MTEEQREARIVIQERKRAYQQAFKAESVAGKSMLADLERFCRGKASTFHPVDRVHCLLEGRREVLLRIQDFLNLSVDELLIKYGGSDVPVS